MCRCSQVNIAKMEVKDGKIEKKSPFQAENEGLRRWKAYLDEKYSEIDMKLGSKTLKMKKKHGKT